MNGGLEVVISGNPQQLYQTLDGVSNRLAQFGQELSNVGSQLSITFSAALGYLGKSSLDMAGQIEQASIAIEVMSGSFGEAQRSLKSLQDYADNSNLTFEDVTKAEQTLMNFGISAKQATQDIKLLGDVTGGNSQKFSQMSLAFAQSAAMGRLMGQDLLQMVNAGFNPLKQISDKTGESMASLKKKMEDGQISFDMVRQAFVDATSEGGRFNGMVERQSQTISGLFSTMGDAVGRTMIELGNSMVEAFSLKDLIPQVSAFFKSLADSIATMDPVLKKVVLGFGAILTIAPPLMIALGGLLQLAPLLTSGFGALASTFGLLRTATLAVTATIVEMSATLTGGAILAMGGAIAIVAALTATMLYFTNKNKEVALGLETISKAQEEAAVSTAREKYQLDQLVETAKSKYATDKQRQEAITKLRELYPDYLKNISEEDIRTGKATEAINSQIKALTRQAEAKYLQIKLDELLQQRAKASFEGPGTTQGILEGVKATLGVKSFADASIALVKAKEDNIKVLDSAIKEVQAKIGQYSDVVSKTTSTGVVPPPPTSTKEGKGKAEYTKIVEEEMKRIKSINDSLLGQLGKNREGIFAQAQGVQDGIAKVASESSNMVNTMIDKMEASFKRFVPVGQKAQEYIFAMGGLINDSLINVSTGIAESLGSLTGGLLTGQLTVGSAFASLGATLLSALGDFVIKVGTQLVASSGIFAAASIALATALTNPAGLALAGVGLIAFGGLLKGLSSSIQSSASSAMSTSNNASSVSTSTRSSGAYASGSASMSSSALQTIRLMIDLTGSIYPGSNGTYQINKQFETSVRVTGK
jgi:tape measure domain-containing protein